jgi:hypothetical protein
MRAVSWPARLPVLSACAVRRRAACSPGKRAGAGISHDDPEAGKEMASAIMALLAWNANLG